MRLLKACKRKGNQVFVSTRTGNQLILLTEKCKRKGNQVIVFTEGLRELVQRVGNIDEQDTSLGK